VPNGLPTSPDLRRRRNGRPRARSRPVVALAMYPRFPSSLTGSREPITSLVKREVSPAMTGTRGSDLQIFPRSGCYPVAALRGAQSRSDGSRAVDDLITCLVERPVRIASCACVCRSGPELSLRVSPGGKTKSGSYTSFGSGAHNAPFSASGSRYFDHGDAADLGPSSPPSGLLGGG